MEDIIRFIKYLKINENGCWQWQGAIDKDGYGFFTLNKLMSAHRASHLLFKGVINEGNQVDHLCRNRPCVNPDHLEQVTPKVNTLRSPIAPAAINSRKTHCRNGHEYTPINTRMTRNERQCKTCYADNKRRYRQRLKAAGLPIK